MQKPTICFISRKSTPKYYSIERVISQIESRIRNRYNVRHERCPFESRGFFRLVLNIVHFLFQKDADIYHITGDVHYLALPLRSRSTILTIHDCASLHRLKGIKRFVFHWLWYRIPVRTAKLITVISDHTRQELMSFVGGNIHKIRVIPDPVSTEFKPSKREFSRHCPVILQIGTKANKNLDRVILSLMGLRCHLRIVGTLSSGQFQLLKDSGITFSNVRCIDDEQVVKEYQDCDMVLFVSTYEGFGLPIIEAQSSGKPLITSHLPPMSAIAGNGAVFADPFDTDSIRRAIDTVIEDEDLRRQIVEAGLENVKKYNADGVAELYMREYENLLNS